MLQRREESLAFLEKVYGQQKAQNDADEDREPAEDAIFAVNIRENVAAGMVEGSASAPVTIVKAFDFACPYCQKVNDTLEELVQQYNGKVRVVYKNFVVHPEQAMTAHLASCAAAKQKKYVEFKNAFWEKGFKVYAASRGENEGALGHENILKIAGELGFDTKKLDDDMKGSECQALIASDMTELSKFKVGATPTLFINGTEIAGALPKAEFAKIIDDKLAIAAKSGVSGADYYEKEIFAKGEKVFRSKKEPKKP
jgi:protein-disulfide isomerase